MDKLIPCTKCNSEKPVSDFYKSTIYKRESCGECKDCVCNRVKAANKKPHRRAYFSTDEFKRINSKKIKRYNERYPGRSSIRKATRRAIDNGELVRPDVCSNCNDEGSVEAHHDDYNYPLSVRWLCKTCHGEWHRHNKPIYVNQ